MSKLFWDAIKMLRRYRLIGAVTAFYAVVSVIVLSNAAWAAPALDKDGLLPADKNPASVPSSGGQGTTTAVPMRDETREAMLLFDATDQSKRYYDFISCLDGLTVGAGNWPQGNFGSLMSWIRADSKAQAALLRRSKTYFEADPLAWKAFASDAKLDAGTLSDDAIAKGYEKLFPKKGRDSQPIMSNANHKCSTSPAKGTSYYFDYGKWLIPIVRTAFRDPLIVAAQVGKWENDVVDPAIETARAMGIEGAGVYLLAFVESNSGQAPVLKRAMDKKIAPKSLSAGGRSWSWATPPDNLSKASTRDWQTLLMWQSMCPSAGPRFRIRNRNLLFFKQHLSQKFKLPDMKEDGRPDANKTANCNPRNVKLANLN